MLDILLNVSYVLIAIAMIVLILLQRGAGAQAGSGFGAGASGTVFGARGSANFLSSTTKYLAVVFFAMSLFMAYQASHGGKVGAPAQQDLGVMSDLPAQPAAPPSATPQLAPAPAPAPEATPAAPAGTQPQAPAELPAVQPATQPTPSTPAESNKGG
jgi:preprotein translocase subunit SecG